MLNSRSITFAPVWITGVNGNRKLISCRQVKFDQFGGSLGVGGFGVDPAEVSVF
jgi:hypothetical protein